MSVYGACALRVGFAWFACVRMGGEEGGLWSLCFHVVTQVSSFVLAIEMFVVKEEKLLVL